MKILKKFGKTLTKILKVPRIFDASAGLTSNIAINKLLSPFYFIFILYYLFFLKKIPLIGVSHWYLGSGGIGLVSTFFYIWCSYYFQPDLDVGNNNKPGYSTFPFGSTLMNSLLGPILVPIHSILGKIWFTLFNFYSRFSTHRGVTHWPIISVWLRCGYLLCVMLIVEKSLISFNYNPVFLKVIVYWLKSFFPWGHGFGSLTWFCFCFPVYVCDLAHEFVDYLDSKRKGNTYCPPQIPRGYMNHFFKFLSSLVKK